MDSCSSHGNLSSSLPHSRARARRGSVVVLPVSLGISLQDLEVCSKQISWSKPSRSHKSGSGSCVSGLEISRPGIWCGGREGRRRRGGRDRLLWGWDLSWMMLYRCGTHIVAPTVRLGGAQGHSGHSNAFKQFYKCRW